MLQVILLDLPIKRPRSDSQKLRSFLSIAAGTFVYVATFDILRDEFPAPGGRLAKWTVLGGGVLAMSLLAIWI